MLPENDPDRMGSTQWQVCYKCQTQIPPAVTFFNHHGKVCCFQCHMEMALAAQRNEPKFGFSGFVPGEDFNWPEDLDV